VTLKKRKYYTKVKMAKDFSTREENYAQWYNDLVIKADLAENSAVRGCMVIKPNGYAIWEKIQAALDKMFKDSGHVNAISRFSFQSPFSAVRRPCGRIRKGVRSGDTLPSERVLPTERCGGG